MVFWVVMPRSFVVGHQRFGGRAASIFGVGVSAAGMYPLEFFHQTNRCEEACTPSSR